MSEHQEEPAQNSASEKRDVRTEENVGHAEDATENRFGELGRRDTFEENRDLGHLGPIVREVRDKIRETKDKIKEKVEG